MLGDVDPGVLEIIASGRDVAAAGPAPGPEKTVKDDRGNVISIDNVLHTIDQEIARLKLFKDAPPSGTVAKATAKLQERDTERRFQEAAGIQDEQQRLATEREIRDSTWDVRVVELTLSDGKAFLVTYGELNTLADFYGSPDEIRQTYAGNFRGILRGVREESYRKFMRLRNELTVGPKSYDPDASEHHFEGAIGNLGEKAPKLLGLATGDAYGELKLMGKIPGKREERLPISGKPETSYIGGLARNACHFAPYSWHAWAAGHTKAVRLALQAAQIQQRVDDLRGPDPDPLDSYLDLKDRQLIAKYEEQAAEKLNEALIENGFADHYLQDSYAAGHLIDKA